MDRAGQTKKDGRLYGTLDGMRGIAAIAVVIVHAPALFGPLTAASAGLAVDLFFVMSGFIISHAYDRRLSTSMSVHNFIVVRTIRLYPLYFMGLMLGALGASATIWLGDSQEWTLGLIAAAIIPALLMLPSLGIGRQEPALFPLNPPSWSLFFELVVNVAYAALFPRLTIKMIAIVVALAGVGLVALAVSHGNLHAGSHWHNFAGGFARVVYSFGAGVLICRSKVKLLKTPPLLILTACAAMFAISPGRYTGAYELTCVLILLPGLVALGAANEPSEFLRPKMAYLGLISYGVYSLHFPLALAAKGMLTKLHGEDISSLTPWAGIIFLFGITIACGAVDKLYDTKVRAFLTSRFALAIARKQVVRVNTTKL